MVSILTFYSDDPSSNPAGANIFLCKMLLQKNENKQKREAKNAPLMKCFEQSADDMSLVQSTEQC